MLISVVIPTFNRARIVGDAIGGAITEAGEDGEVIVVDDGSTDDTSQVLAAFGGAIRVIRLENGGAPRARNAGIRAARGRYVKFVDSDDLVPVGAFSSMLAQTAEASSRDILLGDADCLLDNGSVVSGAARGYGYEALGCAGPLGLADLLSGGMQTELPLFPREALLAVGGFDERLLLGDEKELCLRLHVRGWRFVRMTRVVARLRIHDGARLSAGKDAAMLDILISYFAAMEALLDEAHAPTDARAALARDMWREARDAARTGYPHQAETLFDRAHAIGGRDAVVGGRALHMLYRITTPLRAERLASAAKRLARSL
jgi:glycosyltransferase involved in cell wall biosynthesis